jgi:hypothetical protein
MSDSEIPGDDGDAESAAEPPPITGQGAARPRRPMRKKATAPRKAPASAPRSALADRAEAGSSRRGGDDPYQSPGRVWPD